MICGAESDTNDVTCRVDDVQYVILVYVAIVTLHHIRTIDRVYVNIFGMFVIYNYNIK